MAQNPFHQIAEEAYAVLQIKPGSDCSALKRVNPVSIRLNSFQIVYHFEQMSPGKKALVLLELLINLEENKCPILIDQPEDDLDNRSIYYDLVQFIRKKKLGRQIIVVTHNAKIGEIRNIFPPNFTFGTGTQFALKMGCLIKQYYISALIFAPVFYAA